MSTLPLDPKHFRYSLAINAVVASMALDGRTLLTVVDAQRVAQIFTLLNLPEQDMEELVRGQIAAKVQPPLDPRLSDIEKRLEAAIFAIPEKEGEKPEAPPAVKLPKAAGAAPSA